MKPRTGALVEFEDYGPGWSVAVIVEGEDGSRSSALLRRLESVVESTFAWYSFLSPNREWMATGLVIWIGTLPIAGYTLWRAFHAVTRGGGTTALSTTSSESNAPPVLDVVLTLGVGIIGGLVFLCCIALLLCIWKLVFPKGVYLIGQEIRRDEARNRWRWLFLSSLLFPLIVGLLLESFRWLRS